jgi:hypothetical protein
VSASFICPSGRSVTVSCQILMIYRVTDLIGLASRTLRDRGGVLENASRSELGLHLAMPRPLPHPGRPCQRRPGFRSRPFTWRWTRRRRRSREIHIHPGRGNAARTSNSDGVSGWDYGVCGIRPYSSDDRPDQCWGVRQRSLSQIPIAGRTPNVFVPSESGSDHFPDSPHRQE